MKEDNSAQIIVPFYSTPKGNKILLFAWEKISTLGEISIIEDRVRHTFFVTVKGVFFSPYPDKAGLITYVDRHRPTKEEAIMVYFREMCRARSITVNGPQDSTRGYRLSTISRKWDGKNFAIVSISGATVVHDP